MERGGGSKGRPNWHHPEHTLGSCRARDGCVPPLRPFVSWDAGENTHPRDSACRLGHRPSTRAALDIMLGLARVTSLPAARKAVGIVSRATAVRQKGIRSFSSSATAVADAGTETVEAPTYRANIDFKFIRDNVELVKKNCDARKVGE